MVKPLLLVHGGAGDLPEASRPLHAAGCLEAAEAGGAVLESGGSVVEAACTAVEVLENNPIYNAGVGCALTRNGRVSLDSAVMDGKSRNAAGLAALDAFPNPVRIAQRMMEEPEVLLVGQPASEWAERHGFRRVPEDELTTESARKQWHKVVDEGADPNFAGGTVGCVARDASGNLAAATSTGGTMGKMPGRVGDSPLIGVGTYADDRCALSTTGHGEAFMRAVFAARVADAVRYGEDPQKALCRMLDRTRDFFGGYGGAILITAESGPHYFWTTVGMSHAWWSPDGTGSGI
ncbi:MAG: isoaspartyl peptidase/L-asparaginase family protein [Planctomycetota bacterium]|nr:isoaspartyl peptidase/L-asparaginase family protein [Planctomycetota bacterium]MDA1113332.1 isoaspartyl peptidase/L-asparaginase family protein [Planctomycetota bacterium]